MCSGVQELRDADKGDGQIRGGAHYTLSIQGVDGSHAYQALEDYPSHKAGATLQALLPKQLLQEACRLLWMSLGLPSSSSPAAPSCYLVFWQNWVW